MKLRNAQVLIKHADAVITLYHCHLLINYITFSHII